MGRFTMTSNFRALDTHRYLPKVCLVVTNFYNFSSRVLSPQNMLHKSRFCLEKFGSDRDISSLNARSVSRKRKVMGKRLIQQRRGAVKGKRAK